MASASQTPSGSPQGLGLEFTHGGQARALGPPLLPTHPPTPGPPTWPCPGRACPPETAPPGGHAPPLGVFLFRFTRPVFHPDKTVAALKASL